MRTATGMDPASLQRLSGAMVHHEYARKFSQDDRDKAVKEGAAMPGGRYPIYNQTDAQNAYKDWIRTGRPDAVKAHIQKRVKALNLSDPFDGDKGD